MQRLSDYPWPGNVRELENVLERALILSRSDILDVDSLPRQILDSQSARLGPAASVRQDFGFETAPPAQDASSDAPDGQASPLEDAERNVLLQTLDKYRGHREKTAEALGISRRTLQYKLKKFGLSRRG